MKLAHDTRSATSQIASTVASLTREAEAVTSEIKSGVAKSRVVQSSFTAINDTVRDVADIVAMVDRQTDGIAQSTALIQQSVDSVKGGLTDFAADAPMADSCTPHRTGLPSSNCCPTACSTGWRAAASASTTPSSSNARAAGQPRSDQHHRTGNPPRRDQRGSGVRYQLLAHAGHQSGTIYDWLLRFCRLPHPARFLDWLVASDPRHFGCVISDINGYLPTHVTDRSKPQGSDPGRNAENCRNRRNMIDDPTRRAIESEKEAMLVTYRINLSEGRYLAVKNVFVPLYAAGRRWGNLFLTYRDEALR